MSTQAVDCVCRSCGHVFPTPVIGECPKAGCRSRYIARVQVSDPRAGRLPLASSLPVLERLIRHLRQQRHAERTSGLERSA